jgi:hypothetical protein
MKKIKARLIFETLFPAEMKITERIIEQAGEAGYDFGRGASSLDYEGFQKTFYPELPECETIRNEFQMGECDGAMTLFAVLWEDGKVSNLRVLDINNRWCRPSDVIFDDGVVEFVFDDTEGRGHPPKNSVGWYGDPHTIRYLKL